MPILATKLYIPPPRPGAVLRPRLIERLNEGLSANRKLTLISASAGFGKTTLVSEWVSERTKAEGGRLKEEENLHPSSLILHPSEVAWLSLDEGDNDLTRFLTYLVAALQTLALSRVEGIAPSVGAGVLAALQSPQPPPAETLLTTLINELAALPESFVLVLDDYHVIDAKPVDEAARLSGRTPAATDAPGYRHPRGSAAAPGPAPRRGQLTELRAAELRFTSGEAAEFLNRTIGLGLSADDVTALEARTEGWIAGLQLAALALQGPLSLQGRADTASFIESFTGTHHFMMDYLLEEVLQQQTAEVQAFLLGTSLLDRLCGPLCEAVMGMSESANQRISESTNQRITNSPFAIRTFARHPGIPRTREPVHRPAG